MSRSYFVRFVSIIFLSSLNSFAQLDSVYYQFGIGTVTGGAIQSTDNFPAGPLTFPSDEFKIVPNPIGTSNEPLAYPISESETLPPYVYIEDPNASDNPQGASGQTILLQKFPGIPETNYIPPDPTFAVGPNHIIACVNSAFSIWDKQGNPLKAINAAQWWLPAWPDEAGDPQVIYDHYAGRWVLSWMQFNDVALTAGNLIAYSDDDNPLGTWYMFRLNTRTNGTVNTNNWGDYPQIGFDNEAIYIMTRAFGLAGGGPFYNKIRIISKSDLYTNSTAGFSYRDIWDIGLPGTPGFKPDVIHPTFCYTPGQGGYLFWANRNGGNYYAVYKIINPLSSTPGLRGDTLHVQFYYNTPNANQLGGGTPLIESNGSHVKTAPVIRDGKMYIAHSVGNATYPPAIYASAKYVIYDLASNSITEQAELGAEFYYYIYPTITVDKDHNIAVTYSRSALTEYIGGYYSTKHAIDPPGLSPSMPLAPGLGNYVKDFGSGRNRWGDYLGIFLDPANEYDVWIFPEYAAGTNTWGTYIGQIRMVPFSGIYTHLSSSNLAFGNVEINTISDTLELVIANYGTDDLVIDNIASNIGPFSRISNHNFPITLQSYDSVTIQVLFAPTALGDYDEILSISSNDPGFTGIQLTGHSYQIIIPFTDIFYASSGGGNNGDMVTVSRETGIGTTLGNSLYGEVRSLTVNPLNDVLYGLVSTGDGSEIVRVNADQGDAYTLITLDIPVLTSIDFDNTGVLYVAKQEGQIYQVDLSTGNYSFVTTATIPLNAIAFNPATNQLWGAIRKTFGLGKDSLYTIDLTTGISTPVGVTGLSVMTNDMAFDEDNKFYGVTGASNQEGKIFEINQVDGSGTLIGTGIGFNHILGLAFSINGPVVSVDGEDLMLPKEFSLKQNYPNPFNPSTVIEYSVPSISDVKLVLYNLLGQEIITLVNETKAAGNYKVSLDAGEFTAGVYFYRMQAGFFDQTKKMILLK